MFRTRRRSAELLCPICNEPINLQNTVTDAEGRAVHAECYWDKIKGRSEPKPPQDDTT